MKQTWYLGILSAFALLFSCSKSPDQIKTESDLIGKWTLKNWVSNDFAGSQLARTASGNYKPGEYMQFESGGQFFIRIDNAITPSYWKLLNNDKTLYIAPAGVLDLADDGYEIKTLNSQSLVLFHREVTGSSSNETTIYLEK